jgi:hypothetical protein
MTKSLIVHKNKLQKSSIFLEEQKDLRPGQVRLKIERFAMTSNNITYAVIGKQLKYWDFFPTKEEHGNIPVWGLATVVESEQPDLNEGDRYYGYYPMSTELVITPGKISPYGFTDIAQHRQHLAPIYNNYTKMTSEFNQMDNHLCIFRPLYTTSFLNYDFLKRNDFYNAKQVILTSASSKTALGIAQLLMSNKEEHQLEVVGLTSEKNKDFVKETTYYDTVLSYGEVDKLNNISSVAVDLSGNTTTLVNISNHLADDLAFISLIGLTDYSKTDRSVQLPNSKFFFAPDVAVTFFKEHGRDKATQLIQAAMVNFIKDANNWIEIQSIHSLEKLEPLYKEMLMGKVDPSIGHIVTL